MFDTFQLFSLKKKLTEVLQSTYNLRIYYVCYSRVLAPARLEILSHDDGSQ